jgi:phloretin hydrolase
VRAKRRELTAEEKAKSYSKYYYMEMANPDQTLIEQVKKGPIDPKDMLSFENINDLFRPETSGLKVGYCNLPDGSAYASCCTKMPDLAVEMIDWWFAWHPLDPLRYKIWDPEDHLGIRVSDEDRQRLMDSNIPLRERNWPCTHYVREDFGLPAPIKLFSTLIGKNLRDIVINFVHPKKLGIDMSNLANPEEATAFGAISDTATNVLIARKADRGIEMRNIFWMSPKLKAPSIVMKCLLLHNIKEYTNLAAILPGVYAEERHNW